MPFHSAINLQSVDMKLFVLLFLANLIVLQAAPIRKSEEVSIEELFKTAWEFQNKLIPRQEGIDNDVTELRTSVSKVLKSTSSEALKEVEDNAKKVLLLEQPVRSSINGLKAGDCATNLKSLLNGITEFTGFESSNCVKFYDNSVDAEVRTAQEMITNYDGIFTELQQLVVKAFVGKNQFSQQAEIIDAFEDEYERRVEEWERIKPNVEEFIDTLGDTIGQINNAMGFCMKDVQDTVSVAYNFISTRVETCIDFDNSQNNFKSAFKPLTLDDVLPKYHSKYL